MLEAWSRDICDVVNKEDAHHGDKLNMVTMIVKDNDEDDKTDDVDVIHNDINEDD